MGMIRYLMGDQMGVFWDQFKYTPAHYIKQYINDIERAKKNFKGISKGDAKKFAFESKSAGFTSS